MKYLFNDWAVSVFLSIALIPSSHASDQIQAWFDKNESSWKTGQGSGSDFEGMYLSLARHIEENSISQSELDAFAQDKLGESANKFLVNELKPFRDRGITPSQLQMEMILRKTLAQSSAMGMTWSTPCETLWEAVPALVVAAIPTVFAVINVKSYRKENTPEYRAETQKMTDEKQSLTNRVSAINETLKNQTAIDLKLVGERDQANQKISEIDEALKYRGLTTKFDRNLSVGGSILATIFGAAYVIGGCD